MKALRFFAAFAVLMLACLRAAGGEGVPYEIGADLATDSFWANDPVLFVRRHAEHGFKFTSDRRESADARLYGGVTCWGEPVFESRIVFGETGGVVRVELMLFTTGGTEKNLEEVDEDTGASFLRRTRMQVDFSRDEFFACLDKVRAALTGANAKAPPEEKARGLAKNVHEATQRWADAARGTRTVLTWNYTQKSNQAATFQPGFIRVVAERNKVVPKSVRKSTAPVVKLTDNVMRGGRGDVYVDNVPMVDQGAKGYCAVAAAERVLRYFGLVVDEHDLAVAAGTSAENGTSTQAMKDAVEAIGKRYHLSLVAVKGDFDRSAEQMAAFLREEVRNYNKAAKKLKRPLLGEDVFMRNDGNATYISPEALAEAMDTEVLWEMRVNGAGKAKYARFLSDIRQQTDKGLPIFWGVRLGIYPEAGLPQSGGGHMRLIIGYNDKRKEVLYTDSWGAGHELKRMPADWAWTITTSTFYLKPLAR